MLFLSQSVSRPAQSGIRWFPTEAFSVAVFNLPATRSKDSKPFRPLTVIPATRSGDLLQQPTLAVSLNRSIRTKFVQLPFG